MKRTFWAAALVLVAAALALAGAPPNGGLVGGEPQDGETFEGGTSTDVEGDPPKFWIDGEQYQLVKFTDPQDDWVLVGAADANGWRKVKQVVRCSNCHVAPNHIDDELQSWLYNPGPPEQWVPMGVQKRY